MPVLHYTLKNVRAQSQDILEKLSNAAKNRIRGIATKGTSKKLAAADFDSILEDLIPKAPDAFNFGLDLQALVSNVQDSLLRRSWYYPSATERIWQNTRFKTDSAPDLTKRCSGFGKGEYVYIPFLFEGDSSGILPRAFLNKMAFPWFKSFCGEMRSIASVIRKDLTGGKLPAEEVPAGISRKESTASQDTRATEERAPNCKGAVYTGIPIEELINADPQNFGVAFCTIDGQQHSFGESRMDFPLMSAVQPLLYSLALKEVGVKETQAWTGTEPTSTDPSSFSLRENVPEPQCSDKGVEQPSRIPFNPFMDTGALQTCALIGGAQRSKQFPDAGSRFLHLIKHIGALCGNRRVGYNNSVFLAQKEKRLQTLAVSHFMKGMGAYPRDTDPTDNAHLLFQAQSVELNCEKLSIIAASLANLGVCPTTGQQVLGNEELISLFSLMYNCGLNQYTGTWTFNVGLPATTGVSGACMVIIPNIMGIAIYSPVLNEWEIPPAALKFCESLTSRYRINIFDQLVYRNEELDIRSVEEEHNEDFSSLSETQKSTLLFFELCTSANSGSIEKVRQAMEAGVDINRWDYDRRTALHIAACSSHVEISQLLIREGANILTRDRWGSTPFDEAMQHGSTELIELFEQEMVRQNISSKGSLARGLAGSGSADRTGVYGR
eukprot:gb/GECG01008073.1/.p1 GENE.gb/GECG01008073.1/~~gb/GECG01008073.1/.p1  ORF type:complete len:665 (+),score=73.24 gb/GECG01008073.1/:1-1995(+)